MNRHDDDFETDARRAFLTEAERFELPPTLWPRLEAQLARSQSPSESRHLQLGLEDIAAKGCDKVPQEA